MRAKEPLHTILSTDRERFKPLIIVAGAECIYLLPPPWSIIIFTSILFLLLLLLFLFVPFCVWFCFARSINGILLFRPLLASLFKYGKRRIRSLFPTIFRRNHDRLTVMLHLNSMQREKCSRIGGFSSSFYPPSPTPPTKSSQFRLR